MTGVTLGRNLAIEMAGREVESTGLLGRDLLRHAELRYDGSRGRGRFLLHPEEWQAMSSHR